MSFTKKQKNIKIYEFDQKGSVELVFVEFFYVDNPNKTFRGFAPFRKNGDYSDILASDLSIKVQFTTELLKRGYCCISNVDSDGNQNLIVMKLNCSLISEKNFTEQNIRVTKPVDKTGRPLMHWVDINEAFHLIFSSPPKREPYLFYENSKARSFERCPIVVPYKEEDEDEKTIVEETSFVEPDEDLGFEEDKLALVEDLSLLYDPYSTKV